LTPATAGILLSSAAAGRMARNRTQRFLIRGGFILTVAGMLVLLLLSSADRIVAFVPGLLLIGLGVGIMLTASVNVVQSSFPESEQGEISGLSRSVSNLGSSLGTAIVGSVLVSRASGSPYFAALLTCVVIALIGLGAAILLPPDATARQRAREVAPT
ncbi:MAG TPA: MFS transporter, partial [Candidatus Dormibacteraeota bacterium]|nr:MFS transporter [Candidatus Dormibacteraeota bacterium]